MNMLRILIIAFTVCSSAPAQENVDGFIVHDARGLFFVPSQRNSKGPAKGYHIKAASPQIANNLKKMGNMDVIRGTGTYTTGRTLTLESIDFVGLHKILGAWKSDTFLLNFRSFAEVVLTPIDGRPLERDSGNMQYSITPTDGEGWKIFFSNSNQVILAGLDNMGNSQATLTFYDLQTGNKKSSIQITKITPQAQLTAQPPADRE